ncbi:MAG: tRNA (adenosine(37)-N6)-threonylcarbamoyltransferase complex transferase subunit TsaD, partial [Desulfovibrio sp.]|nr:tRNA (adenosine(37)-N6)-threonylcarbamoyltransferase complex transferase subunit TsaD [Desulfovibrio sp.]
MLVLGIESSCDETALALVEDGRPLVSVLASQADIHALFGGVVPELASREHYRYMGPLFDELMRRAGLRPDALDLVCAARGPGLLGSLLVGVAFAKALALGLGVPFLGVDHLHAHLLAAGIEHDLAFPCLGLLVSGGHTHIYRMEAPWR